MNVPTKSERIHELELQLDSRQKTLVVRYERVKAFFTTEMNAYMILLVGERWEFSELNQLVQSIEDEFGVYFTSAQFSAIRRYLNTYLNVLDTQNKLEKALERA